MRGPVELHRLLLDAGVPHEFVHLHRPADSAADLPRALDIEPGACVALDVLDTERGEIAVLRSAGAAVAPALVASAAGARTIGLAEPQRVSELTECPAAYAVPLGLPADVPVWADAALTAYDVVYTTAGDCATALKIRTPDLLRLTGARVADLAVPTGAPRAAVPSHA